MVFRKHRKSRRFASRVGGFARKSYRHAKKSSFVNVALMGGLYGALRPTLKNAAQPITGMIPSQYGDEAVFGLLGWFLSKKGGMLGSAGNAILTVEAAALGSQLVGGGSTSNSSGGWV